MFDDETSACLRVPFTVQTLQPRDRLALWIQYDDAFVAFLNGVEVARANAPQMPAWIPPPFPTARAPTSCGKNALI